MVEVDELNYKPRQLRKSNSLCSMFVSTTIIKPNAESIINSVATMIHSQMDEVSEISEVSVRQVELIVTI